MVVAADTLAAAAADAVPASPALPTPPADGHGDADLDAALDQLQDRGVEFERFDGLIQDARGVVNAPGGARVAWLRDPDGNLMSVVEFAKD